LFSFSKACLETFEQVRQKVPTARVAGGRPSPCRVPARGARSVESSRAGVLNFSDFEAHLIKWTMGRGPSCSTKIHY